MTQESRPHPDEVQLVAFAEDRLLEFERTGVEAHLADCAPCRTLVSELAEDSTGELRSTDASPTAAGPVAPVRGVWKVLAAAALLLIMARLAPWDSDPIDGPDFELAIASTRDGAFRVERGAEEGSKDFFVGVRLQTARWVRLVGFDQSGTALEIPLDEKGSTSASFEGSSEYVFGPYPLQLDVNQRVHSVALFVSDARLPWSSIESNDWNIEEGLDAWQSKANAIGAQVQFSSVGGSD